MCLIKECDELPVQDWLFCAAHLREYSLGPVKETVAEVLTEEDISDRYGQHRLRVRSEYGEIDGQCRRRVTCEYCGCEPGYCDRDAEHEGVCSTKRQRERAAASATQHTLEAISSTLDSSSAELGRARRDRTRDAQAPDQVKRKTARPKRKTARPRRDAPSVRLSTQPAKAARSGPR